MVKLKKQTKGMSVLMVILLVTTVILFGLGYFTLKKPGKLDNPKQKPDARYLGPPETIVTKPKNEEPGAEEFVKQNNILTIRVEAGIYEQVGDKLLESGPLIVAIVAADNNLENYNTDLAKLASINNPDVTKIVGLSSYKTLSEKLADEKHVEYLKSIGVTGFTYNTERQHTPTEEMNSLINTGTDNYIVKFALLAGSKGFKSYWVPAGDQVDKASSAVVDMVNAGLSGVIMQEQRAIENACPADRARVINDYVKLFGTNNMEFGAQLMTPRCKTADTYAENNCSLSTTGQWASCSTFMKSVTPDISILSVWTPSKQDLDELLDFVETVR